MPTRFFRYFLEVRSDDNESDFLGLNVFENFLKSGVEPASASALDFILFVHPTLESINLSEKNFRSGVEPRGQTIRAISGDIDWEKRGTGGGGKKSKRLEIACCFIIVCPRDEGENWYREGVLSSSSLAIAITIEGVLFFLIFPDNSFWQLTY